MRLPRSPASRSHRANASRCQVQRSAPAEQACDLEKSDPIYHPRLAFPVDGAGSMHPRRRARGDSWAQPLRLRSSSPTASDPLGSRFGAPSRRSQAVPKQYQSGSQAVSKGGRGGSGLSEFPSPASMRRPSRRATFRNCGNHGIQAREAERRMEINSAEGCQPGRP